MQAHYPIDTVIYVSVVAAGLWTIMTRSLIRSAIGLAITSAALTVLMFRFDAWLAAVFELSVCAGLISVIFISAISLTEPLTQREVLKHMKDRLHRFVYLPFLIVILGIGLMFLHPRINLTLPLAETLGDVRRVLWDQRLLDLLGQVIVILTGIFGVVILFKERHKR